MSNTIVPAGFAGASRTLNEFVSKGEVAGGAALVLRHGEVAYRDYAGYADLEARQPIAEDTIYAIYSMSKVITSVALLKLYEAGLFHMHQPIGDFLPNYKQQQVALEVEPGKVELVPAKSPVTMKQLFTMTSGISYPNPDTPAGRSMEELQEGFRKAGKDLVTKDFVNEAAKAALAFHPGERYMYGFSTDVLGGVLEAITGKRLGDYMREEIFEPLGMKDAGFYLTQEQLSRTAAIYRAQDGKLTKVPSEETRAGTERPNFESGGGGLFCSIGDYARFGQMLLNGGALDGQRILGRKTVELMRTDHLTPAQAATFDFREGSQRGCGYGLCVRVRNDTAYAGLNISRGEFGWDGAAGTWFSADPEEDAVLLFMIQRFPGGQDWMHYRMLAGMYAGL